MTNNVAPGNGGIYDGLYFFDPHATNFDPTSFAPSRDSNMWSGNLGISTAARQPPPLQSRHQAGHGDGGDRQLGKGREAGYACIYLEAGWTEGAEVMSAYLVVIEGEGDSYSGYAPVPRSQVEYVEAY